MFDCNKAQLFEFTEASLNYQSGEVRLKFRMDGVKLEERIVFPVPIPKLNPVREQAVSRVLHILHILAGVSYYKAALPPKIKVHHTIGSQLADFATKVYKNGLAEFAHVNQLDLNGLCQFKGQPELQKPLYGLELSNKVMTPVGGGKDSLVTVEALREAGISQTLMQLGSAKLIEQVIAATGLDSMQIIRQLDPKLFEWNQQGAWNGHVPITAILSLIMLLAALLYGAKAVVMSNESSASVGNLVNQRGEEVNHQYSKSEEFEQDLSQLLAQTVSPELQYFSALRELSELKIVQLFSQYPRYFEVFSSCNRNFHLQGSKINGRWCGNCPKCRFVFVTLATFTEPSKLIHIFGKNLLDDSGQKQDFAELAGLSGHKPFECVGEVEETRVAMLALLEREEWKSTAVLSALKDELLKANSVSLDNYLSQSGSLRLP